MIKRFLLLTTLTACLAPQVVFSQDDAPQEQQTKQTQEQIRRAIDEAHQELQKLRMHLIRLDRELQKQDKESDGAVRDRITVLLQSDYEEFTSQRDVAAFQEELQFMEQAQAKHEQTLATQLASLAKQQQALQANGNATHVAADAVQAMAQRLAEAQIDNTLRRLEAAALVDVLSQLGIEQIANAKENVKHADELLVRRQHELTSVQKDPTSEAIAHVNREYERALQLYELARNRHFESKSRVEDRLAEASIELAASELVEESLFQEMSRIKKLLQAGSQAGRIQAQMERLEREVIEVRLAAHQREQEVQSRYWDAASKLDREVALPLRIQLQLLKEKHSNEHPSVLKLGSELELIREQIEHIHALSSKEAEEGEKDDRE